MYAIGLDIGTTSVCGVLHSAETGVIVRSVTREHQSDLTAAHPWQKQQDACALLRRLDEILQELLAAELPVVSIGITGQMHGIVYLNEQGEPVSPLTTWQDGRGDLPYKDGLSYAAYMTQKTGYPLATGYGAVTYFYDTVNGCVPPDAVTFCPIHALAAMHLTGRTAPLLHPSDSAGLGLYDLRRGAFDTEAIASLGLDAGRFPAVYHDSKPIGTYRGIPVAVAIGDNQASFAGSVAGNEESLLVNIGTGSQISCLTDTVPAEGGGCRPFLENRFLLVGAPLCGGRAYALLEQLFREIATAVTGTAVKSAYAAMDKALADDVLDLPPLAVDTRFSGTRTAPHLRGKIDGIGTDNLTMAALCDGVLCGMAQELYEMYAAMRSSLPSAPRGMVGSGNGIRRNPALRRRLEQIFGLPLRIPVHTEEAAFGASLYSLTVAGIYPDLAAAGKLIRYEE